MFIFEVTITEKLPGVKQREASRFKWHVSLQQHMSTKYNFSRSFVRCGCSGLSDDPERKYNHGFVSIPIECGSSAFLITSEKNHKTSQFCHKMV